MEGFNERWYGVKNWRILYAGEFCWGNTGRNWRQHWQAVTFLPQSQALYYFHGMHASEN
jgi:hypothetical protein